MDPSALSTRLDSTITEIDFSGVVQIAQGGHVLYERVRGFAERAHRVPNTRDTEFALASGTKSFTALAVMSLVADGVLGLDERVQGFLGVAGELVDPAVTVRHLLAHTSGMGDYLDEDQIEDIEDHTLEVPVLRLASPADFLPMLRARSTMKFSPGSRFKYCNSGYVVLALLIEAVSGRSYYEVVEDRVFAPSGMLATAFPRLDALPGSAASGYLPQRGWRLNHLHLPVRGGGDGGAYSSVDDIARFWTALLDGRVVPSEWVAEMIRPQSTRPPNTRAYGLGFWLAPARDAIHMEGNDPGISFRSSFEPATGLLYTVISNTTSGAWPIVRAIEATLAELP